MHYFHHCWFKKKKCWVFVRERLQMGNGNRINRRLNHRDLNSDSVGHWSICGLEAIFHFGTSSSWLTVAPILVFFHYYLSSIVGRAMIKSKRGDEVTKHCHQTCYTTMSCSDQFLSTNMWWAEHKDWNFIAPRFFTIFQTRRLCPNGNL